jgi:hypothetical protein
MVKRLPRLRNDVILHQWKGCRATYVDVTAMRSDAMTSRSSRGYSGVRELVARKCYCKHSVPTVGRLLSVWSVPTAYNRSEFSVESHSSFSRKS